MTTIQLTDAQLAQFTACGLIIVDGEPDEPWRQGVSGYLGAATVAPELWRKLTDPCPTCDGAGEVPPDNDDAQVCPNPNGAGGRQVVTLTATRPTTSPPCWRHARAGMVDSCFCPSVVTLGRFTIRLLPVYDTTDVTDDEDPMAAYDEAGDWVEVDVEAAVLWWHSDRKINGAYCTYLALDPMPQPGQWVVQFEAVP